VGDEKLKTKFLRLYSVSVYNERVVSDFGMWNGDGTLETFIWQIPWRRELFDWEKELEKQLMDLITNTHWNRDKSDEWNWVGENVTAYTVQSGYRAVKEVQDVLQSDCFRVIWELSVPQLKFLNGGLC